MPMLVHRCTLRSKKLLHKSAIKHKKAKKCPPPPDFLNTQTTPLREFGQKPQGSPPPVFPTTVMHRFCLSSLSNYRGIAFQSLRPLQFMQLKSQQKKKKFEETRSPPPPHHTHMQKKKTRPDWSWNNCDPENLSVSSHSLA
jgi:hypothetical protein